jgi:hypothetical protein
MQPVTYPVDLANWLMVASSGSFDRPHIDGGGLGTSIYIMKGKILWFIATAWSTGAAIDSYNLASAFDNVSLLDLVKRVKWEAVLLQRGSRL